MKQTKQHEHITKLSLSREFVESIQYYTRDNIETPATPYQIIRLVELFAWVINQSPCPFPSRCSSYEQFIPNTRNFLFIWNDRTRLTIFPNGSVLFSDNYHSLPSVVQFDDQFFNKLSSIL